MRNEYSVNPSSHSFTRRIRRFASARRRVANSTRGSDALGRAADRYQAHADALRCAADDDLFFGSW